jgi:hypothetical protein
MYSSNKSIFTAKRELTSMVGRDKLVWVIFFWTFSICFTVAQTLTGKLQLEDESPVVGAVVFLGVNESISNARGIFRFNNIESGTYTFKVEVEEGTIISLADVKVTGENQDLGEIKLELDQSVNNATDIAIVAINTADIGGEGDDLGQEYSSILSAGRDPFNAAAAFNLSSGRFYARGYNNEDRHVYLNGFAVNDLDDGRVLWGAWGGLNDVLRNQENSFTLQATSFGFGGIGGSSYIDLRASSQRPGTKIVYNRSNRSYTNRIMVTHNSGQTESGWSYSLSGSRRWGDSGYIEGTFYDAWSLFGSVEKSLGANHNLGLTLLASPSERGRFSGSVQEMYDLAGSNYYNANWGFQNGEVRNSRIYRTAQPIAILRHDWNISSKTTLTTSVAGQTGKFGTTRLDWYNANDPRPDYYRKLPSFYERDGFTDIANDVRAKLTGSVEARQLDWDRMYAINQNRNITIQNANGGGESVTGALAAYVVEEQRFDNDKFNVNTVLEALVNDRLTINTGAYYQYENVHNFKVLDDLLGADFYINLNNFALRDFPGNTDLAQNDLQIPNRLVYEGDKFGYNYDIVTQKVGQWTQGQYNFRKVDLFAAVELSNTSFYRNGFYQTGQFPESSLGKSETQSFFNYGVKAGAVYKIDGRNYLYGVGTLRTRAPFSRFAYLSPRTRDQIVNDLTNEKHKGVEAGYVFRYPGLKGRISAYYTTFEDQIENTSFYNDQERTFVNFVLAGVDKKHQGIEFGVEANITSTLSFDLSAGIMANQYTSRPRGTYTQDNDANVLAEDRVIYIKNFYVPGPQQAFSIGFDYRSPKYWFASMNLNHFRNIYLDFNPDRRTDETVAGLLLPDRSTEFDRIVSQEKLPAQFTLDFFGGKSWRIDNKYLYLNISINNILNNKDFRTGGFEQGRFDYEGFDVDRFPPRYFYAFGTTYSIGLTLRY